MVENLTVKIHSIDGRGEPRQEEVGITKLKKINILVGEINGMEVADPRVMTITATDTVEFSKSLDQKEWIEIAKHERFTHLYNQVFNNIPPRDLKVAPVDIQHVVGLILLMHKAFGAGKTPLVKLPETYMHPKQIRGLTQMMMGLVNGE